jgi:hypothetical protein
MSSIYYNEKRNPPIFGVCARDVKGSKTWKLQREEKPLFWTGFGDLVLDFGGIALLRLCVFFWVFPRCALINLTVFIVRMHPFVREGETHVTRF